MHDTLFTTPQDKLARFSFDEQVAACFPDMIRRSVPGYGQMLAMLPILARHHCQQRQESDGKPISLVYDLGTSLGAVSLALAAEFAVDELQICAVDISAPMLTRAEQLAKTHYPEHDIRFMHADIIDLPLQACDMIVLNLTLQFLPQKTRLQVLQKCYAALASGGLLVLTEKTHLENPALETWQVERYYDFKRKNGYSSLEISSKRDALENVLVTDTQEVHHRRLAEAGFAQSLTWFSFFNFVSIAAFKA